MIGVGGHELATTYREIVALLSKRHRDQRLRDEAQYRAQRPEHCTLCDSTADLSHVLGDPFCAEHAPVAAVDAQAPVAVSARLAEPRYWGGAA